MPNGHLQATGTDDAGRRQYLYHPQWRAKRDRLKFDRVLEAAPHLRAARRRVARDLAASGMPRERAAAIAVRLLDEGYFRVGGDVDADSESVGLTTLLRRHVRRHQGALIFRFTGKAGVRQTVTIDDEEVIEALSPLRRRRSGHRLLAYRSGRSWTDLDAADVNDYLHELVGGEFTAKDFRTWHATVIAAETLASSEESGRSKASRRRAVRAAIEEVAGYLGNSPTIAKNSYIDPRVIDLYESGTTIAKAARKRHRNPEIRRADLERAVLDMLGG